MRISDWSSDVCSSDLADTDVVLDGRILGKPRDRDDALTMLASLSDREHEVYSAVAIVHDACEIVTLSVTCVRFAAISPTQAAAYWNSGEPADKAGSYGKNGRASCRERVCQSA